MTDTKERLLQHTRAALDTMTDESHPVARHTPDEALTEVRALAYAIVALEKLPDHWRKAGEEEELEDMRALFARIAPQDWLRAQFLDVSRSILSGEGKPFDRPSLALVQEDKP